MGKGIIDLPLSDRPYEKLELHGPINMTNSELLAIVIKTGTTKLNCLQIAQNILKGKKDELNMSDLEYLTSLSLQELQKFEGIGRVKAIQIQAVIELSKRISDIYILKKEKIISPSAVYKLLINEYIGQKQECLKTILLNKQNKVISIVTNAIGGNDRINIGIKELFAEPIKQMAASIILVHNHPSGSLIPSKQDIRFTKHINEYSNIFEIKLLDHIIIANNNYISMKEGKYF